MRRRNAAVEVRSAAAGGNYAQQMTDAEQRWKNQVLFCTLSHRAALPRHRHNPTYFANQQYLLLQLREGRVKSITAKTAGDLQKVGLYVLHTR